MSISLESKVLAPLGVARVAGFSPDGQIMVRYSKRDYSAAAWKIISPGNGPCVFKFYSVDELKEIV